MDYAKGRNREAEDRRAGVNVHSTCLGQITFITYTVTTTTAVTGGAQHDVLATVKAAEIRVRFYV